MALFLYMNNVNFVNDCNTGSRIGQVTNVISNGKRLRDGMKKSWHSAARNFKSGLSTLSFG